MEETKIGLIEDSSLSSSKNLLTIDLSDLMDHEKFEEKKLFFNGAILISDIVVFNFPWFNFQFGNSVGFHKIKKLTTYLKKIMAEKISEENKPKTIVFVLRDFDVDQENSEINQEIIRKKIDLELKTHLNECFLTIETVYFFLPHTYRKAIEFKKASEKFSKFLFSHENKNLFLKNKEINSDDQIEDFIAEITKFSFPTTFFGGDLNNKEIAAYRICSEVFLKTLFAFKNSIEPWKICCEEGGIIQNFGKETDRLIEEFIEKFEQETSPFNDTKVFISKKKILKFNLLSMLQEIFDKQLYKLKELSFQSFKESLSSIQVTGDVENQVNAVIQITEKYFINKVDSLTPSKAKGIWFSEKERKELVNGIREMATERLQAARLQGIYLKKTKNPISLSFYYLHPHPFGKDLRLDHMTLNDSLNYNPDLTKRAGLMRQFVATQGDSKKLSSGIDTDHKEEDFIYQEEPMKSFQK